MRLLEELHFILLVVLSYTHFPTAQDHIELVTSQVHPLRPRSGLSGHQIEGLDCLSWRLAVETDNLQHWRTVPPECEGYVGHYMLGDQYKTDCEMVTAIAYDYVKNLTLKNDGKDIWIFDIDETTLSNLPYYARADVGFGAHPFNSTRFREWVAEAKALAIPSVLKLYERLLDLDVKIVFLTGTRERLRQPKENNMRSVGYHTWEKFIMKGDNERCTTTVYKSRSRSELEKMGYRIIGNMGDQWTDLLGPSAGLRTFKIPDPMYYVA